MSLFDKDLTNPTITVDEVNGQSDLGALLSATKRLEAPGQAVSRHHLVMILIVMVRTVSHFSKCFFFHVLNYAKQT